MVVRTDPQSFRRHTESQRRKWVREAGRSLQRMNQQLSPTRRLVRLLWGTVGTMDVLQIPPASTCEMKDLLNQLVASKQDPW